MMWWEWCLIGVIVAGGLAGLGVFTKRRAYKRQHPTSFKKRPPGSAGRA